MGAAMKSRDEIAVLFEAAAVALEAITDALHHARTLDLCCRLERAGDDYAGVLQWARLLANDLPSRRRDHDHMIFLARGLRAAVQDCLRPVPAGLNRADLNG